MLQHLQKFAKFRSVQLDNLVNFDKCCKTRIYLQRSSKLTPPQTGDLKNYFALLALHLKWEKATQQFQIYNLFFKQRASRRKKKDTGVVVEKCARQQRVATGTSETVRSNYHRREEGTQLAKARTSGAFKQY